MSERVVSRPPVVFHREVPRSHGKRVLNPVQFVYFKPVEKLPHNEEAERRRFRAAFDREIDAEMREMEASGELAEILNRITESTLGHFDEVQAAWQTQAEREARRKKHYMPRFIIRRDRS